MPFSLSENPEVFILPKRLREPFAWVEHIPFAFHLIKLVKPRVYVELGVHIGNSFSAICQAVKHLDLKTKCYGIDNWTGDVHAGFYPEEIYRELKESIDSHYVDFASLLRMSFDQGRESFTDGTIDLLHIDGLHTYDAVKADFETWLPKMSDRGVIMFHDTAVRTGDFGVWRLWDEVAGVYPSFQFLYGFGLGIIAVGPNVSMELLDFFREAKAESSYQAFFGRLGAAALWRAEKGSSEQEYAALEQSLREEREKVVRARKKLADANLDGQFFAEMSFDRAQDASGEQTIQKEIDGRESILEFSVPAGQERVRIATFRPLLAPVALRIHGIEVQDRQGQTHVVKDFASNHFFIENGVILFDTDKPKFTFTLQHIEQPTAVRISLSYVAMGPMLSALLYKRLLQTLEASRLGFEVQGDSLVINSIDSPKIMPPREKKSYDAEMLEATLFLHEELRKKDALLLEQRANILELEDKARRLSEQLDSFEEMEQRYLDVIDDRDKHFRGLERALDEQKRIIDDRDKHFRVLEKHLQGVSEAYEARLSDGIAELNAVKASRGNSLADEIVTGYEPSGVGTGHRILEKWRRFFQKDEARSTK